MEQKRKEGPAARGQGGRGATRAQDQGERKTPEPEHGARIASQSKALSQEARSSLEVVHGGSGDGSRNSALGPEI